jgi:chromate transporter
VTRPVPPGWLVWSALGTVYILWGSTYLAIRYVVDSLPPLLSAGSRFALAGLVLAAFLLVRRGRRALVATRRQYANAAVVGLLLETLYDPVVTSAVFGPLDLAWGIAALVLLLIRTPPWLVVLLSAAAGAGLALL